MNALICVEHCLRGDGQNYAGGATGQPPKTEIDYKPAPPPRLPAETSDEYPHVVAVLDSTRRIIECPAGLQWIIQVRKRNGPHPWASVSFCRTKEALLRLTGNPVGLQSLPDCFPERARHNL
jgi:hypothetical protein